MHSWQSYVKNNVHYHCWRKKKSMNFTWSWFTAYVNREITYLPTFLPMNKATLFSWRDYHSHNSLIRPNIQHVTQHSARLLIRHIFSAVGYVPRFRWFSHTKRGDRRFWGERWRGSKLGFCKSKVTLASTFGLTPLQDHRHRLQVKGSSQTSVRGY